MQTPEQLRHHYEIEKELAARLRDASRDERPALYRSVYEELFRLVPDHPQLGRRRARDELAPELRFLAPHLDAETTLLELGAGDCALSLEASRHVKQVFALDVSPTIVAAVEPPDNLTVIVTDGRTVPLPPESVDVVYSNQLLEHLHPDDAVEQLRSVRSVLKPGGICLCVTPNRLSGPHDISRSFDEEATGLHLKEYTHAELRELFQRAGFSECHSYAIVRGRNMRLPMWLPILLERVLGLCPGFVRKRVARRAPVVSLLGVQLAAAKLRSQNSSASFSAARRAPSLRTSR